MLHPLAACPQTPRSWGSQSCRSEDVLDVIANGRSLAVHFQPSPAVCAAPWFSRNRCSNSHRKLACARERVANLRGARAALFPALPLPVAKCARANVGCKKRKAARCLFAVAAIDPKLRVEAFVALIQSRHAAIARIPHSDKLRRMITIAAIALVASNSAERRCGLAQFRLSLRFFTLHCLTLAQTQLANRVYHNL